MARLRRWPQINIDQMKFPVAVTALAIIAAAWFFFLRPAPPPVPFPLRVAFTADTSGRIEPCGCFTGQFGGITRVSTALKPRGDNRLLYEIGDAIAGTEDYHRIQYDYLLRAFGDTGYTAVNLGHREAKLSADQLRAAAATSPVPLVSANLLDSGTNDPVVAPWVLTEQQHVAEDGTRSTLRVATIGVVDPERMNGSTGEGIALARMDEVLRHHLPEMKDAADLLVCLAFTDRAGLHQLATEFYEFRFILGGDVAQPSQELEQVNRTWTLATTNEARALGMIEATWQPESRTLEGVQGEVALMVDMIPQDPVIKAHSDQYREDIRDIELAVDSPEGDRSNAVPGVEPAATYVGSAACAGCHAESSATWSKSGHAHAFESLLRTKSDADPSCIRCHTVGFGEPGGYLRSIGNEKLVNVGCESCHGPGSEHVRLRTQTGPGEEVALKLRAVGAGQCTQCHHGEFSRPFEWKEFWPLIEHGKEEGGGSPK